jgi:hypothetical protein
VADPPGTLEQLALGLGRVFQPLETRLGSGDVLGLLEELGLTLPPALLGQQGFVTAIQTGATAAAGLPQIMVTLTTAIEGDDGPGAVAAGKQLIDAATGIVGSFTTVGNELQAAGGALPGVTPAVVDAFAAELPTRLLEYVVISFLESFHPVFASAGALAGIIDRAPMPGVDGDATQPAYIRRTLNLNRVGDLLQSPQNVFQTLYGWGDPGFDGSLLLLRLRGLLAAAGVAAGFDPPSGPNPPKLHFLLLSVETNPATTPPGLKATLGIPIQDALSLTVPLFKPGWSAVIETAGTLDAGVSVTVTPPSTVAIQPPTGSVDGKLSFGFLAAPVAPATALVLFGQSGGSRMEVASIKATAGLAFSWDSASGTAKGAFMLGAGVKGGKVVIDLSSGDGFIQTITGGARIDSNFDLDILWSADGGLCIEGSGALQIAIPTHISIGPIDIEQIVLSSGPASDGSIDTEVSATFSANLGPLQASVERIGVLTIVKFPHGGGNLGPADLSFAFKPPTGVGLSLDAGIVSGGGYLYIDADHGEYAGALQLTIADFLSVSAIGLISTRMPDGSSGFSLLIIITADFGAGIQLGFGFTLLAVGGLLGLNRSMLFQPLMDGIRTDAIESVMFPHDVVANAPRIISDLRAIFPPQPGTFLIGPMAKLGWGEPTLVSLSLGIIVEIPPGDIAILGVLKLALPAEDLPILVLQVNFAGAFEFDKQRFYFFASLYDSHILFITIEGEMGVLVAYGDDANFVVSVGGFHPQFNPPPLPFPTPKRIQVDIINESFARIHCDGYFAVTSNTVQFGSHSDFFFGFSAVNVQGHSGFDALIQFSPFHFVVEISTSFSVEVFGIGVFGIGIDLTLEGPTPWHAHGTASLSFFFFSIDIGIDVTFGDSRDTSLPPVAVMPILVDEFGKQSNWRAALPAASNLLVSLRQLDSSEAQLILHPIGTLQISQRAVPLDLVLDKVGNQKPTDTNRISVDVTSPGLTKAREHQEPFALGQFKNLDDAARLSQAAYTPEDSGIDLSAAGHSYASATAITRIVRYDLTIVDTKLRRFTTRFYVYSGALFAHFLGGASVARSTLSAARKAQTRPYTETVHVGPETFAVALRATNTVFHPEASSFTSYASAKDYADRAVAQDPALAGTLHVLPQFEVAA